MLSMEKRRIVYCVSAALLLGLLPSTSSHAQQAAGTVPQAGAKPSPPPLPPELQKVSDQYSAAVKLHIARKYNEAITAYQLFLKMAKDASARPAAFLAAYTNMASIYQLIGDKPGYEDTLRKIVAIDPKDVKALAQLAIVTSADHKFADATKYADRVISLKPSAEVASSAHFVKGNVAASKKDFNAAARAFAEAVRLTPRNALCHFNLGLSYAELKKYDTAQSELQTAVRLDPTNARAKEYLGKLQTFIAKSGGNRNGGQVKTEFDEAIRKNPHDVKALLGRAKQLEAMGKLQDATSAYIETIAADPENIEAHMLLGKMYYRSRNWAPAKDHFGKAHTIAEKSHKSADDGQAIGWLANAELGEGLSLADPVQRNQSFSLAETHAKQSAALLPADLDAKSRIGRVYEAAGKFKEAELLYKDVLKISPDNLGVYTRLAATFQSRGDVKGFVDVWKEYQAHHPDDPTSYEYIADVYNRTRNFKGASEALRELLQRKLTNSTAAAARVILGQDLVELSKPDEAKTEFKTVLALTPSKLTGGALVQETSALESEQRTALRALAALARKENKVDTAIEYLEDLKKREQAIVKQGGQSQGGDVYRDIATLYEHAGKLDLAIKQYEAMAQAVPKDPSPHEEMGRIYELQKKLDLAEAQYRQAASKATTDPVPDQMKIAEMYQRAQKPDRAMAELEALYKKNLKNVPVMTALALSYLQMHQESKALAIYDAILKVDPSQQWVNDRRATTYLRMGKPDEAERIFKEQLDHQGKLASRQTYSDLMNVYKETRQEAKFLPFVKPRFEKDPANATLINVVYDEYVRLGKEAEGQAYIVGILNGVKGLRRQALSTYAAALQSHNHPDQSLEIYRTIAAENARDISAQVELADQLDYNQKRDEGNKIYVAQLARKDIDREQRNQLRRQLALRYVQQNLLKEARAVYEEQFKLDVVDFDSSMRLGDVIEKLGDLPAALEHYQKLLSIPTYPPIVRLDIRNRSGAIYEKLNKKDEAIAQYREALHLDPSNATAAAALKKLGG
jgi:tetratricopeptide (TPR) repeat protein